jgi:glycine cleavage system H protein
VSDEYLQTTVDKFIFRVKRNCLYTEAGVWVVLDEARGVVRAGLSDFRQQASGDVAFVDLPAVGQMLQAGEDLASIETVKVDLAVPAPCAGRVVAVNAALAETPELVNQDPYGAGWLVELAPDRWPVDGLLDAEAYLAVMTRQAEEEAAK